jgi:phosphate transport system ATP-binding protein
MTPGILKAENGIAHLLENQDEIPLLKTKKEEPELNMAAKATFPANFNSIITVQNLSVYLHNNQVLKNLNFEMPDKAITCIIGPSGCGKTTLLKTFNRLLEQSEDVKIEGKILLAGKDIHDKDIDIMNIRKSMGLLSQRPCPLPMSIYDNIAYGPRIHGIRNKKKLNQIVERYLKEAGLLEEIKDRLHTPANRLSIGQQQRLCLARGLAVEPEIILGDEVTSALDPVSSKKIEELFIKLKKDYSIVLVTHTLRQARRIADHIVFMYLGEVIEAGPASKIFDHPEKELTKKYLSGYIS